MARKLLDLLRSVTPLNAAHKEVVQEIYTFLDGDQRKRCVQLLRQKSIAVFREHLPESIVKGSYPQFNVLKEEKNLLTYIAGINKIIKQKAIEQFHATLSVRAHDLIIERLAPHLRGYEPIKEAVAIQLFATENFHILLLGDPGTGKTDILRAASDLAPISSYGLGSGMSGVGLSATRIGKELIKGLLPSAHEGICCIDELNLLRPEDRGSLLNAMEKGFISYDKGRSHIKIPARVNVLATANPKGDRFVSKKLDMTRRQMPFDEALLTRFNLIFIVRRPDVAQFLQISKRILEGTKTRNRPEETQMLQSYITHAKNLEVTMPKEASETIMRYVEQLKRKEGRLLLEVNPRIVHGIINMTKARARMHLRSEATQEDVNAAIALIEHATTNI
ncbi:MAG: ATP-binding protein [Nanoarchaeota archaeon]